MRIEILIEIQRWISPFVCDECKNAGKVPFASPKFDSLREIGIPN